MGPKTHIMNAWMYVLECVFWSVLGPKTHILNAWNVCFAVLLGEFWVSKHTFHSLKSVFWISKRTKGHVHARRWSHCKFKERRWCTKGHVHARRWSLMFIKQCTVHISQCSKPQSHSSQSLFRVIALFQFQNLNTCNKESCWESACSYQKNKLHKFKKN